MRDIWDVAYDLELATVDLDLPVDFDFTDAQIVATLPDSDLKAEMLGLLGGHSYTARVRKLTRKECYEYIRYTKKHSPELISNNTYLNKAKEFQQDAGKRFNLSACTLPDLREIVLAAYPTQLPELVEVSYDEMREFLKVVKELGVSQVRIKLNAKYSDMVGYMGQVFGCDWKANLDKVRQIVFDYVIAFKDAKRLMQPLVQH